MRALTDHQRSLAIERATLVIGFDMLAPHQQASSRREARLVVEALEKAAMHGASEKRACEILLAPQTKEKE